MATERVTLSDEMMEVVSGGSITYTPASLGANYGKIGINRNEIYHYENEQAVVDYVTKHYKDKSWTSCAERDQYLLNGLLQAHIIK